MAKRKSSEPIALEAAKRSEPNQARALELVMRLMAIPGKSGEENLAAEFIFDRLHAAGVSRAEILTDHAHKKSPFGGNTGNIIVKLPGTIKAPRRMLSAHIDTVPICVGAKPKREGDVVRSADPNTGLGADDRAGAAVILNTLLEILEHGLPHPPLTFCWLVQEEVGLYGARHIQLPLLGKPAMCFNWDGGPAAKLTIGATGGYRMNIEVRGIPAHAGVAPEKGVSAIAIAACAIADLQRNGWHGLVLRGSQRGTSNVGMIAGGEATNVVTDIVRLRAEARSHVPKFRERIVKEIEKAFERAAKEIRNDRKKCGSVLFEGRLDYEAFLIERESDCVQAAEGVATSLGLTPELAISNGGLDANWLNAHGIPTVSLGCGQANIHTTQETLVIPEFENACRIALGLATC